LGQSFSSIVSVAYSYETFPEGENEKEGLNKILEKASSDGLRFITDQDARPQGSAHVLAHLWDNGKDVSEELDAMLNVRKTAIDNFSIDNIPTGQPNSVLEDVFVPLYFFHRYQTEAVAKVVGGLEYNYAVKGDGQNTVRVANRAMQEKAMKSILNTLDASVIAIPKEKLSLFPPRAFGYGRTRESINSKTGVAFDPFAAAETAANMTLGLLLNHERLNRLIQQKSLDNNQLGIFELIEAILSKTVRAKQQKGYIGEIQEIVNWQVLQALMQAASHKDSYPQVTEAILFEMMKLKTFLGQKHIEPSAILMKKEVEGFIAKPKDYKKKVLAPKIPDGSPIGMDCFH